MQPSLLLLIFVYVVAAASGLLLVASGMYGQGPIWLADFCTGDPVICRYPFLAIALLLPLLFIYKNMQAAEPPDRVAWARRLRRILD